MLGFIRDKTSTGGDHKEKALSQAWSLGEKGLPRLADVEEEEKGVGVPLLGTLLSW